MLKNKKILTFVFVCVTLTPLLAVAQTTATVTSPEQPISKIIPHHKIVAPHVRYWKRQKHMSYEILKN